MAIERPPSGPGTDPMTFFHDMDALRTDDPALAEPMDRALARIVDFVITFAIYIFVSGTLYGVIAEEPAPALTTVTATTSPFEVVAADDQNVAESWISGLVGAAVAISFLAATEVISGRSFGKRIFRLRVVNASGFARPTGRHSLVRFLALSAPLFSVFTWWTASFMSGIGLLAMISFIAVLLIVPGRMFFADDRRGLHDRLAGTRVVVERYDTAPGSLLQRLRRT